MLLNKTMVPLIKEDTYFIYGDSDTGQLYRVFETKQFSINKNRQLFFYIIGATVIKQIDRLYLPISTILFNVILLMFFMTLIYLKSRKQIKEWENFIEYEDFQVSEHRLSEIVSEAGRSLKINVILLITVIALFLLTGALFIFLGRTFFIFISLILWYVLSILTPTLHLKNRKIFIATLRAKVKNK